MKYLCVLFALCAMSIPVHADALYALRSLDAWAGETVDRAVGGSATVRELVAIIDAARVVVHVETATAMPATVGGMTRFVASSGGYRYVRITLLRSLCAADRATMLGHELQHASEIAASSAANAVDIRRLFEDLDGRKNGRRESFETRAAVMTERRVAVELRSRSGDRRRVERH